MNPAVTDRTRIQTHQECPRKRYWRNEYKTPPDPEGREQPNGIVPNLNPIPFVKGGAIHKGVEFFNNQLMNGEVIDVEAGVAAALTYYEEKAASEELQLEPGEITPENYVYNEQKALIEFGVRGYAHARIPYHRTTYRPVAVEQERLVKLADDLVLMGRSDADLQRYDTKGYYIFSFKTSFAWDNPNDTTGANLIELGHKIDNQGISEAVLFEAITGQRVDGIHMEFFINGSRKKDYKDKGTRKQDTWTVRPWMKQGIVSGDDLFAWKYYFEGRDGFNHSLGKSYKRVNIWEIMPVKDWVELLISGKVQPDQGDPFRGVFIAPTPIYRDDQDVVSWVTEVVAQEQAVVSAMEKIRNETDEAKKQVLLDQNFPRYRHSCINKYRKVCPYFVLCWGGQGVEKNPVGSGMFKARSPHHDYEIELQGEDD